MTQDFNPDITILEITNLRLRTIIGFKEWERKTKQDVIINIKAGFDADLSRQTDQVDDTMDYKILTKKIIKLVEESNFNLIEKLNQKVLDLIMEDSKIIWAKVKIEKPFALRFSDSVSITLSAKR